MAKHNYYITEVNYHMGYNAITNLAGAANDLVYDTAGVVTNVGDTVSDSNVVSAALVGGAGYYVYKRRQAE